MTRRLPPIVLSSKSLYCGDPVCGLLRAGSSDHGAGMGLVKHPPDPAPPATPPPPPSSVALPPMETAWITTPQGPDRGQFPAMRS